jgi:hypothetical protein
MKKLMTTAIALAALAGPAFAQSANPNASVNVNASVANGCTLTSTLATATLTLPAGIQANTTQVANTVAGNVAIVCNTPSAVITVGSNPMTTNAAINPAETSLFTNSVDFQASLWNVTGNGSFDIDSRPAGTFGSNVASSKMIGNEGALMGNRRARTLQVHLGFYNSGGLTPVAGSYVGTVCVTVDPSGTTNGAFAGVGQATLSTCVIPT